MGKDTMLHSATRAPRPAELRPVRVASIPASHVYVRHLAPAQPEDAAVERLPDPRPPGSSPEASQWWPPVMLDADWIAAHGDDFDLMHLHFGFDAFSVDDLRAVVAALRTAGKPLVFTVHDLRNPHHTDRRAHDEQLDVLVPAADELITLTPGAAAEIARRWGRTATVIGHPHVVELDVAARLRDRRARRTDPFRIGVHLKSLRACMDAEAVVPVLVRAARELPGAVLQVNGHRDVLEPGGAQFDARLAAMLGDLGDEIDLRVHDFFSDAELWDYLGSLDVSVLPYRHGTHSGWLEACRDLGTDVVAPSCGYYADQAPVHTYRLDETTFDEESLVRAIHRAHDAPTPLLDLDDRARQRDAVSEAHRAVFTRLVRS
ncbi:glycosyltransferase [Aeromicrobium yanjiei]|nr:glycosyltransferase [Aeromicrobium yanjiei]